MCGRMFVLFKRKKNAFLFDKITKKGKSKLWYIEIHIYV